jgi:hypothetical protein
VDGPGRDPGFGNVEKAAPALRASEGKDNSGILFYDEELFHGPAIGAQAKAIARAGHERRN